MNTSPACTCILFNQRGLVALLGVLTGLFLPALTVTAQVNQPWVARYTHNTNSSAVDAANPMALDSAGNIFVAGSTYTGVTNGYDYVTVKYAPDGTQLWAARYGGLGDDKPSAIIVDVSGNVLVTGTASNDFGTVKYDANGTQLWADRYDGPGSGTDDARAITVDASGQVYVTGRAYVTTTTVTGGTINDYAYATIKYTPNGIRLWVSRYSRGQPSNGSANQNPRSVAVDQAGNVYVTGGSVFFPHLSVGGARIATVKYGPNGNELGVWTADSKNSGGDCTHMAVLLAPENKIYVAGTLVGGLGPVYTIIKYATNGVAEWDRIQASGYCEASATAVDSLGNIYVTGSTVIPRPRGYLTVKYDPAGNLLWSASYTNGAGTARSMAVDGLGNVYVTGASSGPSNFTEYATVKYSSSGTQLWAARYSGSNVGNHGATALALNQQGDVFVAGFSPPVSGLGQDTVTLKYTQFKTALQRLESGHARLDFVGPSGLTNRIQFSTDFLNWIDLETRVADSDGAFSFEEPTPASLPMRFYRSISP